VDKSIKIIIGIFISVILLSGTFAGGFIVGHLMPATVQLPFSNEIPTPYAPPTATTEQQASTPSELQTLFVPFWEAWNIVHEQYVDQPIDDIALMRGAIRGMMDTLGDEQTFYMEPSVYDNATSQLEGEYEGIGAYVDLDSDYLTIVSPIAGSPAEAAGLKPGDKIVAVDGEDMTGVNPEQVRQKVIGPAGTDVKLSVTREGESQLMEFTITRAVINISSVTGELLENDIAYIDINTFGDKTTAELRATLDELLAQNPKGIIIDLRFNPGGYLHTSVEVASEFIEDGVILYEQYGDGTRDTYRALDNVQATDLPIVVLINEGSASASEILAGAFQDYGRATLVGVKSYGKGSVQQWMPLSNDQGAARVTIARWLTPNERAIDHVGLTPDVYVTITEEDYTAERDPQLDAAIQTLKAILLNVPIPTSQPAQVNTPIP